MKEEIDVSIVIVCMNNLKNLYPCLDSINNNTSCKYETFIVAYLFSKENLVKLKEDYDWVTIIESNEIRGFSENNNLALKKASGKFCFVLNDDTFFSTPVIDQLFKSFDDVEAAIISPNIVFPDGSEQCCGRPKMTWYHYILRDFKLWKEENDTKYSNKKGIFQSYNILGAAFMIRTSVFKELNWFDERYFFCPEDVALSTELNKQGYNVYVNSNIILYHIGGGSNWSNIAFATKPAAIKGGIIFYSAGYLYRKLFLTFAFLVSNLIRFLFYYFKSIFLNTQQNSMKKATFLNVITALFSKQTPKSLFIKFYSKV